MMRDLFYTSLALVPWTGGLIVGLLLLRRWAGRHISPHFFHLAFLVLALRLAFPVDVSLPAVSYTHLDVYKRQRQHPDHR